MGVKIGFVCKNCKYEAICAGGKSRTRHYAFKTYECLDCNEIMDISLGDVATNELLDLNDTNHQKEIFDKMRERYKNSLSDPFMIFMEIKDPEPVIRNLKKHNLKNLTYEEVRNIEIHYKVQLRKTIYVKEDEMPCPACNSDRLVPWTGQDPHCPKCGNTMGKNFSMMID